MKCSRKLLAILLTFVMALSCNFGIPVTKVNAAKQNETKDSWVDPGNYTRGWYDSVTGLDIYGNEGTEEDPYEIKSAKDLAGLSYYSNIASSDSATTDFGGKYITILANKIDLSAHYWYPIGTVQNFKGVVNGNGAVIENMYIGKESKYETCGNVGLFGAVYADVKDISIENAVIYSNSVYAGGFVGRWLGGNIANCSVEGQMYQIASSANVGGFVGYHVNNDISINNSYTNISIEASTVNSSSIGGFVGYCNNGTFTKCYSKGNIQAGSACNVGGFGGNIEVGKQTECFSMGNIKAASGNIGVFIGAIRKNSVYNSYALGNIESENNSNIGGFIGYAYNHWIERYYRYDPDYELSEKTYKCSMNIENCYSSGSIKSGSGSVIGGFFGVRQYAFSTIVFKKCYWNQTADQIINGTSRTLAAKLGVAYAESRTVVGAYASYMKSQEFADDLNEYVYQNSDSYNSWEISENVNNGFPYLSGNKSALVTINGGSKEIELGETEDTSDMKVYGTVIYPEATEPTGTETPSTETPDQPDVPTISVGLQWGSLEYVYKAGKYDKETKTYAEGAWSPKEEGVTDKISLTNHSETDIQANYTFLASTEGSGNYANLIGEFRQKDADTAISGPVIVRSKEGDIEASQDVFLKINGIPAEQKKVTTPEVIGTVVVTISKYIPKTEPVASEEPTVEVTEKPSVTEEPAVTVIPTPAASEEPAVSQVPDKTETPETSQAPAETETSSAE